MSCTSKDITFQLYWFADFDPSLTGYGHLYPLPPLLDRIVAHLFVLLNHLVSAAFLRTLVPFYYVSDLAYSAFSYIYPPGTGHLVRKENGYL